MADAALRTTPRGAPADPEPVELAAQLRLAVARLYRTFRLGGDRTMSTPQHQLLMAIDRSGPMRLADLAAQQAVPPSNLTRSIRWLSERGYIERAVSRDDRRSVIVTISPAGRTLVQRAETEKAEFLASRIDDLTAAQQRAIRQTIPLLDRLLSDD